MSDFWLWLHYWLESFCYCCLQLVLAYCVTVFMLMYESLVLLTWNNIVARMMSLNVLVGLQEKGLALVLFRLHQNAGTRNWSQP